LALYFLSIFGKIITSHKIKTKPKYNMKKNTYYTLSFILVGLILLGGRYLGYGFIERVVSALVIGGLFELVYRKKLKK
tara:strand:+ start:158 stop:391 length:234 start_codon:yes stop_codon:yes gene_type:complete